MMVKRVVITALYEKERWRDMRRSDGLTYHALIALIVQVVFLPLTITALVGVAKVQSLCLGNIGIVFGLDLIFYSTLTTFKYAKDKQHFKKIAMTINKANFARNHKWQEIGLKI